MPFNIGDTVRLKSGGPLMTVTDVGTNSTTGTPIVWVNWFYDNEVKQSNFPSEALEADDGILTGVFDD